MRASEPGKPTSCSPVALGVTSERARLATRELGIDRLPASHRDVAGVPRVEAGYRSCERDLRLANVDAQLFDDEDKAVWWLTYPSGSMQRAALALSRRRQAACGSLRSSCTPRSAAIAGRGS